MNTTVNGSSGSARDDRNDPFAGVLDLGNDLGGKLPPMLVVVFAVLLHGGVVAGSVGAQLFTEMLDWARSIRAGVSAQLAQTYEVEVVKPEEKPPEPEPPPPEPEKEQPKEEPPPVKEVKVEPKADTPPPPPAAAEAAKVLTQEPAKDEPVDLTGNAFVTGSGSTFAGGTTQAGGTSKSAVYSPAAAATGVVGGTGTAPSPGRVDRSRAAGLLGNDRWDDCPFPGEADSEQIDQAFVTVQIKVKPDGSPETVTIVQDPGHGFAREARKCAMQRKYATALDADGNPVGGLTKPIRIRFER